MRTATLLPELAECHAQTVFSYCAGLFVFQCHLIHIFLTGGDLSGRVSIQTLTSGFRVLQFVYLTFYFIIKSIRHFSWPGWAHKRVLVLDINKKLF